jgi:hypothetical protein
MDAEKFWIEGSSADMKSVRFEATSLIVNLVVVGFGVVYLTKYGLPKASYGIAWVVAVGGLCYCFYACLSSVRTIDGLLQGYDLELSLVWVVVTCAASLLLGAGLGVVFWWYLLGQFQTLLQSGNTPIVAVATACMVLPVLWRVGSALNPILINRKAIR